MQVSCANCGCTCETKGATDFGYPAALFDGQHYFCSDRCRKEFRSKSSGGTAAGGSSASAGEGLGIGAGVAMAGAGIGAAAAGAGAALKGAGALLGGLGKGFGAMGDLMKDGLNQSKSNTKLAQDMLDKKFSDDPETYKKEISDLYELVMEKGLSAPNPQEWTKKTYAKKRLLTEFASMARTNPALYANYAHMHEALKKKKSPWAKYLIGFAIIFGAFMIWAFTTVAKMSADSNKLEASEAVRLEAIVKEIDDAIAIKDYDTALYKATKLQADSKLHWSVRESWDKRREETIATIEKLSGKTAEKSSE